MTAVELNGAAATAADCPKSITALLAGSASGWLTDANKLIWTGLTTSTSDGYKLTISIKGVGNTVLADTKVIGGCVATATSNAMCIYALAATNTVVEATGMKVYALTKVQYTGLIAATAGTEITLATWGMVLAVDCSAANPTSDVCGVTAAGIGAADGVVAYGWTNYQPKETSDKVYATIPRFSKDDLLVYKGLATTGGLPDKTCGSGKALTGASALVAGAAIAFGAAALAF
jgi:uncharacterized protein YbaA (DUF1428 family)